MKERLLRRGARKLARVKGFLWVAGWGLFMGERIPLTGMYGLSKGSRRRLAAWLLLVLPQADRACAMRG